MKPTFEMLGSQVGRLVEAKNAAYGSSFAASGDFLRLLFPHGVPPERFDDALLLVRIFDKQMRIATDKDAFGESPYQDIAGYGLLGMKFHEGRNKHECASARQDAAEGSAALNASAARNASSQTTANVDELSARRFVQPSKPPSASTSDPTAAPAPNATATASESEAVHRNKVDLCAVCPKPRGCA